jgi:hypothetical protein
MTVRAGDPHSGSSATSRRPPEAAAIRCASLAPASSTVDDQHVRPFELGARLLRAFEQHQGGPRRGAERRRGHRVGGVVERDRERLRLATLPVRPLRHERVLR